jgi:hypothetical protein
MAEQQTSEFFIDIRESYVDAKLREFFEGTTNDVNIDNICLFAAKTVEEYNQSSETKLKGKQKHEAAVDLAKRVIEKSVAFVADEQKRQTIKNLYYNIESIPQTIDFIVNISNNPNIVNAGKWVVNKIAKNVTQGGCFSRLFSLCKRGAVAKEGQGEQPETKVEEKVEEKPKPLTKEEKRKLKMDEERKKREEKLQKELEDLRLTPEEKAARVKAAEEERKKAIEDAKKAKEEEKLAAKKAIEDKKEEKRLEKLKKKEAALKEALEKLNSQHTTPKEEPAKEEPAKEEPVKEEPVSADSVVVEETKEE